MRHRIIALPEPLNLTFFAELGEVARTCIHQLKEKTNPLYVELLLTCQGHTLMAQAISTQVGIPGQIWFRPSPLHYVWVSQGILVDASSEAIAVSGKCVLATPVTSSVAKQHYQGFQPLDSRNSAEAKFDLFRDTYNSIYKHMQTFLERNPNLLVHLTAR